MSQRARSGSQYGTAAAVAAIGFGDAAKEETEKQRDIIKSYEYGFCWERAIYYKGEALKILAHVPSWQKETDGPYKLVY